MPSPTAALYNVSLETLIGIAEDTANPQRGAAAMILAYIYLYGCEPDKFSDITSIRQHILKDSEAARRWAKIASEMDDGSYSGYEYFYLAEIYANTHVSIPYYIKHLLDFVEQQQVVEAIDADHANMFVRSTYARDLFEMLDGMRDLKVRTYQIALEPGTLRAEKADKFLEILRMGLREGAIGKIDDRFSLIALDPKRKRLFALFKELHTMAESNLSLNVSFLLQLLKSVPKYAELILQEDAPEFTSTAFKLDTSAKRAIEACIGCLTGDYLKHLAGFIKPAEILTTHKQVVEGLDQLARKISTLTYTDGFYEVTPLNAGAEHVGSESSHPGFEFIKLLVPYLSGSKMIAALNACLAQGVTEANDYFERSKIDGRELQARAAMQIFPEGRNRYTIKKHEPVIVFGTMTDGKMLKVRLPQQQNVETVVSVDKVTLPLFPSAALSSKAAASARPLSAGSLSPSTSTASTLSVTTPVDAEGMHSLMAAFEARHAAELLKLRTDLTTLILDYIKGTFEEFTEAQERSLQPKLFKIFKAGASTAVDPVGAERAAFELIAEMRRTQGQLVRDIEELRGRLSTHEQYLFNIIKRINELGAAYAFLCAKVAKQGEADTINEALRTKGYTRAAEFMDTFISMMEIDDMARRMIASRRFAFDFGRRGLVLDTIVSLAGLVPVTGVSSVAGAVRNTVRYLETRAQQAESKKIVSCTGNFHDAHNLATSIAIAILKYNGQEIIKSANHAEVEKLAKACSDSAIKYIKQQAAKDEKIYAEDIAYAILSGFGMESVDAVTRARLIAIVDDELLGSRYKPNTRIERDWLAEVLETYGKDAVQAQFADLPLPASSEEKRASPVLRFSATRAAAAGETARPEAARPEGTSQVRASGLDKYLPATYAHLGITPPS